MSEGGVTQIVSKGNRFGQIFVESEGPHNVARHLRYFEHGGRDIGLTDAELLIVKDDIVDGRTLLLGQKSAEGSGIWPENV